MNAGIGVRARLARVFSAQVYNQVTTMAVQLALVPLLLHSWGTERYGVWLLLSAIPTYLTLSDFGFTFIAKNEMVMQVAAGQRDAARRTFQSVFALLSIAAPGFLLIVLAGVWSIDVGQLIPLGGVSLSEARSTLALLLSNILFYQFSLLVSAGIRCENRAASESIWAASARLGEGVAIGVVALTGGSLFAVAASSIVNRAVFNLIGYLWMRRNTAWLRLGYADAQRTEIWRLLHPALGYMLMPISQALVIQGPVLLLGAAGPLEVVIFSTSRTLARVGTAVTNMLNNTLVAEYSARAGHDDEAGFARLFRLHLSVSAFAIAVYSAVTLALGHWLIRIFTHGKVTLVEPFFAIMVAAVAAEMLWTAMFTPISAINRHIRVTYWLLGVSVIGVMLCWLLVYHVGLAGAALALLGVHGAMIVVCLLVGRAGRLGGGGSTIDPAAVPVEPMMAVLPTGEGEMYAV